MSERRYKPSGPGLRPAALWLLWACLLGGCTQKHAAPEAGRPAAGTHPRVVLHPASGAPAVTVQVELARTAQEQARGLMFRRELPPDSGMLFLFDQPGVHRFWMKNCFIPLDMIFFDASRRVVGIEEQTIPHDENSRGPDEPTQFVLEVVGGYSRIHGVGAGTKAEFLDVE